MGVPTVLFWGSLSGLCLRCALILGFAPLFCCGGLLVLLVLFASLCVLCSRSVLSMALLSCAFVTRTEIASRLLVKGRRPTREDSRDSNGILNVQVDALWESRNMVARSPEKLMNVSDVKVSDKNGL